MGMYPVGVRYEQGDGAKVTGNSCTGAAPVRLLTYADLLYLQAELVNVGLVTGNARLLLENAIKASFSQVDRVVTAAKGSQTVPTLATAASATTYLNAVLAAYDAATTAGKLEIIMTQKWIQSFGSSVDQWTDYRRTGYPIVFDPKNPAHAPGGFVTTPDGKYPGQAPTPIPVQRVNEIPLSLPWGQEDLNLNPNAPKQKVPSTFKVFWDN